MLIPTNLFIISYNILCQMSVIFQSEEWVTKCIDFLNPASYEISPTILMQTIDLLFYSKI